MLEEKPSLLRYRLIELTLESKSRYCSLRDGTYISPRVRAYATKLPLVLIWKPLYGDMVPSHAVATIVPVNLHVDSLASQRGSVNDGGW